MAVAVVIPRLGWTMEEGVFDGWLKREGDQVHEGERLFVLESDKAATEVEAVDAGILRLGPDAPKPRDIVKVGQVVGYLVNKGERAPFELSPTPPGAGRKTALPADAITVGNQQGNGDEKLEPALSVIEKAPTSSAVTDSTGAAISAITPRARRMAAELKVACAGLHGTGKGGRIRTRDVLAAARPVGHDQVAPARVTGASQLQAHTIPLSNMRQVIARRLLESKQTVPHFYVTIDVVMDQLLELRRTANEQLTPLKLTVTDFIARATAVALAQSPAVNAGFSETAIVRHGTVNLGIAVAIEEGLLVPVVRDAQTKSMRQLSGEIKQLVELARNRKLTAEQMTGGTFTISNLGMYGVTAFQAIINPPESAILAIGSTQPQPIVRDGQVVAAQVMTVCLSADHRVVDGVTGAEFLGKLKVLLENPLGLLI